VVEDAGCVLVQGNLFARSMPAAGIEALLTAGVVVVPKPRRSDRSTGTPPVAVPLGGAPSSTDPT
jgi:hypothetical protein